MRGMKAVSSCRMRKAVTLETGAERREESWGRRKRGVRVRMRSKVVEGLGVGSGCLGGGVGVVLGEGVGVEDGRTVRWRGRREDGFG